MLCSKGASILQTKSLCVQEAANELIEMLCEVQEEEEVAEDDHRDHGEFITCLANSADIGKASLLQNIVKFNTNLMFDSF